MFITIRQSIQGGKLSQFSCFFTQPQMFSVESFTSYRHSLLKEAARTIATSYYIIIVLHNYSNLICLG